MRIVALEEIRRAVRFPALIDAMQEAVIAQSRGECETPMPMHLRTGGEDAEVHIKSSWRRGGKFWALKAAGSFPGRVAKGLPAGSGMILLCSVETGEPAAFFLDGGWMTDARTAAVSAMAARALGRRDTVIGVLGTGVQARLQVLLHAEVLPLERAIVWGRSAERLEACRRDLESLAPGIAAEAAATPSDVAGRARLLVTATAARGPLLEARDLAPGTHVSAVGSDSPGKQELDPEILRRAALLLVDSLSQCERLGELQHALSEKPRAIELGRYCASPSVPAPGSVTVCDFTGLGVEDLAIAELVYVALAPAPPER